MRAYELYESEREPKVGDAVDFPDDTITDKGPCDGSIRKISGDSVWFSVSDTVYKANWKTFTKNAETTMSDKCWTFVNKDGAQDALIDYEIDVDKWSAKGMPLKESVHVVTQPELNSLEAKLDNMYAVLNIDVDFSRHFMDRVNDRRNGEQITIEELQKIFTEVFKRYKNRLAQEAPGFEAVMNDISTELNIPFVFDWDNKNKERDMVAKTVMRKSNFQTPDEVLPVGLTSKKR